MDSRIYSVSEINGIIREIFDEVPVFHQLYVCGEISNYKKYPSGHHYFTLKDSESCIKCVMFRSSAVKLRFSPANGQKVLAAGHISAYPRDGVYQLYCEALTPFGAGDLNLAFEQIKAKLAQEGLYDEAHKKLLPEFPGKIAVITSPAGAAVHDMIRILGTRWPLTDVLVVPVKVQGEGASEEIAAAISYVNQWKLADLIITGRGGGSLEDLWAFNEESVARAIYASHIPVISAVGHEPDVTISDYVADMRASTPSNAAELAVRNREEIQENLKNDRTRLEHAFEKLLTLKRQRLDFLKNHRALTNPLYDIEMRRQRLDLAIDALSNAQTALISRQRTGFIRLASKLDALSPLKVLTRGYSIAEDKDGNVISSAESLKIEENISVLFHDGKADCTVRNIFAYEAE